MTHTRLPDWRKHLLAYLQQTARTPFEEGFNDCALFVAGGVLAMTGNDFAAPYRGQYSTTVGGMRLLRDNGFADHIALAKSHLAAKPVAFAHVGDAAVMPSPDGPALGIVQGPNVYVLAPSGLAHLPLTNATEILGV